MTGLIGFGVVGAGTHGARYLRHLALGDVPGARAVSFWRRDSNAANALADRFGVPVAPDWRDLIEDPGVDAIVVATPPGAHPEAILAAAEAGKPVLSEKPVAATLAQALDLSTALPEGARVMVAQTLRWSPALIYARARVVDLGGLHRVRIAQRLEPSPLAWQRDAALAGRGSVTLTGVHGFDLLHWLTGASPDRVSARTRTLLGHPFENLFDARFEYADRPLIASCEVAKTSASRSGVVELVGPRGQIWVDWLAGRVEWVEGATRRLVAEPGDQPTIPPTLGAFCQWVRAGGPCPVPLAEGIEALRMADACYRSDRAGGVPVAISPGSYDFAASSE